MNRQQRTKLAQETVGICEKGFYIASDGVRVSIENELSFARAGTRLYRPEMIGTAIEGRHETALSVHNESTFQALARLTASAGGHVACLNFASAKNPGGGFLNGSIAQEEALALASGVYPCLLQAPEYYERNRANRSTLYLDLAIFSPMFPFFRDDAGTLLPKHVVASVITAPAPNAGAVAQNEPENLSKVEPTLRRRAEFVLGIASTEKVERLVLGAWGCGVFRNDPTVVGQVFADLLKTRFERAFAEVVFAVLDRSEDKSTYKAFEAVFNAEKVRD